MEPVTSSTDPTASSFGAGCALWLQFTLGGQPQLGKTPLWDSLDRARTELGRSNLQLSSAEALSLAPILGVTHIAVGTLRGVGPHMTLTYTLVRVPSGAPVGPAVTLTGTQAEITFKLPEMAHTLAGDLDLPLYLPHLTDLSAEDLEMLGQQRWRSTTCTAAERTALEALSAHDPVAGLININRRGGGVTARMHSSVETLLAQAGNNPLAWGVIAKRDNWLLLTHADQLSALTARYPNNSILAIVDTIRDQLVQDHGAELAAAKHALQCAPHSPDCQRLDADALSHVAGDERQGRTFGALSQTEAADLNRRYAQAEAADQQAVQLDPRFADAWCDLAVSATFNSHTALADHALSMALKLSLDKARVYDWALEMYQPKWNEDRDKLVQFAQMAAADSTLQADEVLNVARELKSSGFPELRTKVLNDFIARKRAALAAHPGDGQAHFELAAVLEAAQSSEEAMTEYQQAVQLLPQNASAVYHLGVLQSELQHPDQAKLSLEEVLKLEPDFPEAHYALGILENDEAEFKAAVLLNPAYGKAYAGLGGLAAVREHPQDAIGYYQSALQYGDNSKNNYVYLVRLYRQTGQFDQVMTTGTTALSTYGDSILYLRAYGTGNLYDDMASACLSQKHWDDAQALSRSEIEYSADDPAAHENLAEAYLGLGEKAQAQQEWKKVLTYDDDIDKTRASEFLKQYP